MFYFLLFAVAQARVFRGASKSTRVFRFSAEMAHFASGGIGEEHFHERLAAGQAAAADGELMDEYEDDRLEDAMADCPAPNLAEPLLSGHDFKVSRGRVAVYILDVRR